MRMRMRMRMMLGLVLVSVGGGLWGAGLRAPAAAAAALPLVSTVQVRLREDARLRCPLLDNTCAADNSTLSWYRTVGGGGPQMLLTIKSTMDGSTVKLGTGLGPEKVAAAADGSLLLRRSEHRDAAVYYCGISQGGGDKNPGLTEA